MKYRASHIVDIGYAYVEPSVRILHILHATCTLARLVLTNNTVVKLKYMIVQDAKYTLRYHKNHVTLA